MLINATGTVVVGQYTTKYWITVEPERLLLPKGNSSTFMCELVDYFEVEGRQRLSVWGGTCSERSTDYGSCSEELRRSWLCHEKRNPVNKPIQKGFYQKSHESERKRLVLSLANCNELRSGAKGPHSLSPH